MKARTRLVFIKLVLLSTLDPQLSTAFAQGATFTYQGRLPGSWGAAPSGSANPATIPSGSGPMFYRLKKP